MTERYWPFDAGSGATVIEDDWFKMARGFRPDGVVYQYATEITSPYTGQAFTGLKVTAVTGMDVSVAPGVCGVHGGTYENTAAKTLTATTAPGGGNSRKDLVVLRLDRSANTIGAVIVAGTPAVTGSEVDPALSRSPTVWDVPLARLQITGGSATITSVTDIRQWAYVPNSFSQTGSAVPKSADSYTNLLSDAPNLSDYTGASMADWLTGLVVPVPVWAQDGLALADLVWAGNGEVITAAATFAFRLVVASSNGITSGGYQIPTVNAAVTMNVPFGATPFPIPAGTTSLAVKVQAQRTAGTGALRFGTSVNSTYSLLTVMHR